MIFARRGQAIPALQPVSGPPGRRPGRFASHAMALRATLDRSLQRPYEWQLRGDGRRTVGHSAATRGGP
jgi:hypothetical protein